MSGSLSLSASLIREFDNAPQLPLELPPLSLTLTNQELDWSEWKVGTTAEDMPIGDVQASNQGYLVLINLDSTNYVTWGPKVSGSLEAAGRIKPGRWAIIELEPGTTYMAQANGAEVKLFKALQAV